MVEISGISYPGRLPLTPLHTSRCWVRYDRERGNRPRTRRNRKASLAERRGGRRVKSKPLSPGFKPGHACEWSPLRQEPEASSNNATSRGLRANPRPEPGDCKSRDSLCELCACEKFYSRLRKSSPSMGRDSCYDRIFFISHAMFLPRLFMVCTPSASLLTSPGCLPMPMFQ